MSDLKNHPTIKKYIEFNEFGNYLGMSFEITSPGFVVYKCKMNREHLATPHAVHGGVIAALCDALLGVGALSAVCEEDKVVGTVEMKVTFLSPAFENDLLMGNSTLLRRGRSLVFMEGLIENQDGKAIAKASGTFNAYPKEKAGY
jgi:uncharacterized protein (TIGR00369 family)